MAHLISSSLGQGIGGTLMLVGGFKLNDAFYVTTLILEFPQAHLEIVEAAVNEYYSAARVDLAIEQYQRAIKAPVVRHSNTDYDNFCIVFDVIVDDIVLYPEKFTRAWARKLSSLIHKQEELQTASK